MRSLAVLVVVVLALASRVAPAAADELATRILIVPLEVDPSAHGVAADALTAALERAAERAGAVASLADASLAEAALIVGCDSTDPRCLDQVAAALNVDRILFGTVTADDDGVAVVLSITSREGVPAERRFALRGDTEAMTAALERDVAPFIVEASEKRADVESAPPERPAPAPAPPPPPPPRRDDGAGVPGYAWATIGGGVALAAAGGGIALWGRGLQDDIDGAPTATAADLDALRSLENDAQRRTRAGTALLAVGLVAAGAGATFAVLGSRERRADRPGDVAVAPALVPGGAGVSVTVVGF